MADPTYVKDEVEANVEWHVAWTLSEILNDNAPIGWSRYCGTARCLLAAWDMTPKATDTPPAAAPAETDRQP
jgi:hypothetical protein